MPFVKVDVPAPPMFTTPVVCNTPGVDVAIPTPRPPRRYVDDAMEKNAPGDVVPMPIRVLVVSKDRRGIDCFFSCCPYPSDGF